MEVETTFIDQHIQTLGQEIDSWIAEVWTAEQAAALSTQDAGWLIAVCSTHPCNSLLAESLRRLQRRFPDETLSQMAADMYFYRDRWYQQYQESHEQRLHWPIICILNVCLLLSMPQDVYERIIASMQGKFNITDAYAKIYTRMFVGDLQNLLSDFKKRLAEGNKGGTALPEINREISELSLSQDCLGLIAALPPSPQTDACISALLQSGGPYRPEGHPHPAILLQVDRHFGAYLCRILCSLFLYGNLNYEVYRHCALLAPQHVMQPERVMYMLKEFMPANVTDGQEKYLEFYQELQVYWQRLLAEVIPVLSKSNCYIINALPMPLHGLASGLLHAADQHSRLKLGRLADDAYVWMVPDSLAGSIVRFARAEDAEPLAEEKRRDLIERLRHYPFETLEALIPVARQGRALLCLARYGDDSAPLLEYIFQIENHRFELDMRRQATEHIMLREGIDVAGLRAMLTRAGAESARALLTFFQQENIERSVCYLIEAAGGWNRADILAEIELWRAGPRQKGESLYTFMNLRNQLALKGYGLLPLERGEEEAQERYTILQQITERYDKDSADFQGIKSAMQDACRNLAQVAGYPQVTFEKADQPLTEANRETMIAWARRLPNFSLHALLRLANNEQQMRCFCEALYGARVLPLVDEIMHPIVDVPLRLPAIRSAIVAVGDEAARAVLQAFQGVSLAISSSCYLIEAIQGWNRKAVYKSLKHDKQLAIEAYALLPLERGEDEVLERYLELQSIARHAQKFGPQRSVSHRECVQRALQHLANLAGYPDSTLLEWDMEAKTAQDAAQVGRIWTIGEYTLQLELDGMDVSLSIARDGRKLKAVPGKIRSHEVYQGAKDAVKMLREQISRLKRNLFERFIATGESLDPALLKKLNTLPTASTLFSRMLLCMDEHTVGLFDAQSFALSNLQGELLPITKPVMVVHPYTLYTNGTLGAWQREIIRRRIVQPIKQAFRELYVLTPAEQQTRTYSLRFADRSIDGAIAKKLFISRRWGVEREDFSALVTPYKVFPGMRAIFETPDAVVYALSGPVTTGRIFFEPYPLPSDKQLSEDERMIQLEDVPPLIFSEVMRDADLVVSVAARQERSYERYSNEVYEKRAELIQALLADLNLQGVSVEGSHALVQGKLARYRVHLGSASIHIEPGSYLCIVPEHWGRTHPRLFLPFADENDGTISEVISKIFLLLADDQIQDESIVSQIRRSGVS